MAAKKGKGRLTYGNEVFGLSFGIAASEEQAGRQAFPKRDSRRTTITQEVSPLDTGTKGIAILSLWYGPVILSFQEDEPGGSQFQVSLWPQSQVKASLRKLARSCLKVKRELGT